MCKKNQNMLYFESTQNITFIQLDFKECMYNDSGSVIYCDLVSALDGGFPYLIFKYITLLSGKICNQENESIQSFILNKNYIDIQNPINEYRIKSPSLFSCDQVDFVINTIIPNFYGDVCGFDFYSFPKLHQEVDNDEAFNNKIFLIKKTNYSDVYELNSYSTTNGIEKVRGNNLAYIPTLDLSKKLYNLFKERNSLKMECEYNFERQKWTPIL